VIIGSVDAAFTLIWRRGQADTTLAQWVQHWEPLPGSVYKAQPYEVDEAAPAIDWQAGDQLVFRYAALNTTTPDAFIPNGDGPLSNGRIPSIALPP
jgi:FtsP/CotA-like multicopper oxidase with cupredoxin domain